MNKAMIRAAMSMIGKDKISNMFKDLISNIVEQKQDIKLNKDETDSILIAYIGADGEAYAAIAYINDENHITRFENRKKIAEFVESQLNNF